MNISRQQLQQAVAKQVLSQTQADDLWQFLSQHNSNTPKFDFTHILYYLGGLIAIGAMSVFMTLGWDRFGGWGIVALCLLYAMVGLWLTHHFAAKQLRIPAGICATFVLTLVPLAVYGLQQGLGMWPDDDLAYRAYHTRIEWHWLYMELATLAAAAVMLHRYRYPFLVMPVALTLWYLSMDVVLWLNGGDYGHELRQLTSLIFGLAMTALAFWVDVRNRSGKDFAFWLYLFGVLTFWGGLSLMDSGSEWGKLMYGMINVLLIGIGALLSRRVFVVFGALGLFGYLSYLAYDVFQDSWLFPISLTLLGAAIIFAGVWWQKNERRIGLALRQYAPAGLRDFLAKKG